MKLEINNVTKQFNKLVALDDVSLSFETGHIYALLGRNGAGKSTLMNIITRRIFPDSGEVLIDGKKVTTDELLSKIYLMSETNFYDNIKVKEAIKIAKIFDDNFDDKEAFSLSKSFGLNTKLKIGKLSTGYSSIFKVIMALCASSPFILFDEPILGLDANHRNVFYKLLLSKFAEKADDVCFIISTHLIEEVSTLIESAVIIKEGKILVTGSVEDLLKSSHCVIGKKEDVERCTKGLRVLGSDIVGNQTTSVVVGDVEEDEKISVSTVDLQRLFIELTNKGGF